ncbi:hypothetical protein DL770_005400 [Monosporascus sp. CRB-9-2]|nr:hypothetical protein DL770_005400 [Monosporascus sp. CRB-9-2]
MSSGHPHPAHLICLWPGLHGLCTAAAKYVSTMFPFNPFRPRPDELLGTGERFHAKLSLGLPMHRRRSPVRSVSTRRDTDIEMTDLAAANPDAMNVDPVEGRVDRIIGDG